MILCIGDRVCSGYPPGYAWPEHLWEILGRPVVNGGAPGMTTVRALRAMPVNAHLDPGHVVLQLGADDARGGGPPPALYLASLEQAIHMATHLWPGAEVVVCSTPRITKSPHQPTGFSRPARRWVGRVRDPCLTMADAMGFPTVDITGGPPAVDGVHPSPDGHRWIARQVADVITR